MVWCGVVRCGAVRCGAVRCGAVRCGVGTKKLLPTQIALLKKDIQIFGQSSPWPFKWESSSEIYSKQEVR